MCDSKADDQFEYPQFVPATALRNAEVPWDLPHTPSPFPMSVLLVPCSLVLRLNIAETERSPDVLLQW